MLDYKPNLAVSKAGLIMLVTVGKNAHEDKS